MDRPETLRLLHNKWRFAGLLHDLGLPFPNTRLIENPAQAASLGLRFPLIAKPLEGQGGIGNVVCRTLAELEAHVASAQHCDQLPVLAQEYAPGADVVFGVLADKGTMLAWTIQKHLKHGRMEFLRHEPILEIGRKILSHLGFSGVAEFDLRLNDTDGSLQVLECNPRFWYSVAFSFFAGVDFVHLGMERAHSCGSDAVESQMGIFIKPERAVWEVILGRLLPGTLRVRPGMHSGWWSRTHCPMSI